MQKRAGAREEQRKGGIERRNRVSYFENRASLSRGPFLYFSHSPLCFSFPPSPLSVHLPIDFGLSLSLSFKSTSFLRFDLHLFLPFSISFPTLFPPLARVLPSFLSFPRRPFRNPVRSSSISFYLSHFYRANWYYSYRLNACTCICATTFPRMRMLMREMQTDYR